MNELIDFALMRHGKLGETIAKCEADIEKLQQERNGLEEFVARAQELAQLASSERSSEIPSPRRLEPSQSERERPAPLKRLRPAQSA